MISLNNIKYKYPKKEGFALDDITLSVRPGEIFTLLGPNGAGKTSLIRILAGLIIPREGSVSVCGYDIDSNEYRARKSIGLVLGDERTFYFRLSGAQNLEFFGGLFGGKRRPVKRRVAEVLELVGLEKDAGLQYMRYSTGMKKRLSLARALMHEPEVLLLDEPNSGVDPHSARKIREVIVSLKEQKRTILLTTHDMEEAEKMSDTIGFLKNGKLIKTGNIIEYKNLISKKTFEVEFSNGWVGPMDTAAVDLVSDLRKYTSCTSAHLIGTTLRIDYNGSFNMSRALAIISQRGFDIHRANTLEASLEDVFIKLAG